MMVSRTSTHRYCSTCPCWHNVNDEPCEACYFVRCQKCGAMNEVFSASCSTCGEALKITLEAKKAMTHPSGMMVCPVCRRKLRFSARDKRRKLGLKKGLGELTR